MLKRALFLSIIFLASGAFLTSAPAQDLRCDRGDKEVRNLEFRGNRAFTDAELSRVIVTTPSSTIRRFIPLPFTVRRCLDRQEFPNDRLRLLLFYRKRGYPDATVDTAIINLNSSAVTARFIINEGRPVVLRSLVLAGLDSVESSAQVTRNLPIKQAEVFDRVKIDAARDSIARRLRNRGYPDVQVQHVYVVDTSTYTAVDTIHVTPGPLTRIGAVNVSVIPYGRKGQQISDQVVKRIVGVDSGDIYREQRIINAQQALYQTEAYQHVSIGLDTSRGIADSTVDLTVSLVENAMRAARIGVGYGTLDCFRTSGELTNFNFLRGARRLDITGRVSKIGIGEPLSGAKKLCADAQSDPYSNRLNYHIGAQLRQPVFFGLRSVPTFSLYSERVSEFKAYLRTTAIGGDVSVLSRRFTRSPINFTYGITLGRTEAQPALFCAVFNLCNEEDRDRVQQTQKLGVFRVVMSRDRSNNPFSPTRGSIWKLELSHASRLTLSDSGLVFNKMLGEISSYTSLGGGNVFATRLRLGGVLGSKLRAATEFVPPQERMYGGGPNSVRGFAQNELGSIIYLARTINDTAYQVVEIPDSAGGLDTVFRVGPNVRSYSRAVPSGGNTMLIANAELRLRSPFLPDLLQWTFFADAGDVWNRGGGSSFQKFKLKVTPGIQLAAFTPIGPVRVLVGYNPYDRPSGPIYYETPSAQGGALPCVSPGNTIPVHDVNQRLEQEAQPCPATFKPEPNRSFRSRLQFSLAIGQAF